MTARWLRWMVFVLLAWSTAWLVVAVRGGGPWAWLAMLLPLLVPGLIVGFQFLMARWTNRTAGEPLPSWGAVLRGWWVEWWLSILVFGWLQPFRAKAYPDRLEPTLGRRGVVLVHGFSCNRAMWWTWLRALTRSGRCFVAVDLSPPWGPIEAHVGVLDDAVQSVQAATGMAPVVVCHSMGGLVARAWLGESGRAEQAHRILTFGTPHGGTRLAQLDFTARGRQMLPGHPWLQALDKALPREARARFACWYSDCDSIVFPVRTASLAGATNRPANGLAHMEMAFDTTLRNEAFAISELDA